ncbi:MAG: extracellular solute-binding protein [Acidobacteriaceae bacterium]|nr:extracellular solute-binding protein [Acidobacteriaceae bacterium]
MRRVACVSIVIGTALLAQCLALPAWAVEIVNVYTIWPENWTRPMFDEFERDTGIKVNAVRFSSRWALARIAADRKNPPVDVLFGGRSQTFDAGIKEGLFEPYKPPSFRTLPLRFRQADGQWIGVAHDPLVFMTNSNFVRENKLKPPTSWNDLLASPYRNMLQLPDARTSDAGVMRIFSVLEVNGRDEAKAFAYMKKLRRSVQLYIKTATNTAPIGVGDAAGGVFSISDALAAKARGYDVTISLPREGIGTAVEGIALVKGARNPDLGKKLIDWATSPAMQNSFAKYKVDFVPVHPDAVLGADVGAIVKGAKFFPMDTKYVNANRERIVNRWVNEVVNR